MAFRVGQKVVCVNATDGYGSLYGAGYTHGLREGAIYTISKITDETFVSVAEIKVGGWRADRFRPIVEKKTDISIFTAMLKTKKQGANA